MPGKGWKTYDAPKDWEETRLRILRRDHWRCVICNRKGNQVDHIIPVSQGGSHDDDNLRVLCYDCHKIKSAQEGNDARRKKYGKRTEPHPGYREL